MKINPFRPVENNPYQRQVHKQEGSQSSQKTDKVEISSEAQKMQSTPSIVKEREMRVAALKKQVQHGDYQVDPQEVAKSIAKFFDL
ncbi:flagellar biosynthesis anti-sigma factor FlgM [Lederbergia sp. NSJ-179]|uniref:flagellar biosynthesis anti-sigma factor FlgM n=1 Tax=Lederbergia sp. NSJ-179 TaxID=2931402 RepID=UPI001FD5D39C|nr:flagellar biosynthesis anti-sigma factor FlgM [Lederbergia sp. NSJ-179]MCJ7843302.1 flagellar biosynthesis anti-sigma factor FlgM [Lederbergia sp. NSJ-179]